MTSRLKTELEKNETPFQESQRLRFALLIVSTSDNLEEAKRVALCAMRGELHGHEIKEEELKGFP